MDSTELAYRVTRALAGVRIYTRPTRVGTEPEHRDDRR